jgi:hypothetical protein
MELGMFWSRDKLQDDFSVALIIRRAGKVKNLESRTRMNVFTHKETHFSYHIGNTF